MTPMKLREMGSAALLAFLLTPSACGGKDDDSSGGSGGSAPSGGAASGGAETGGSSSGGSETGGASDGGSESGGNSSGGAQSGGMGGEDPGAGGSGGAQCPLEMVGPLGPGATRSAGFSGTDAQYSELYSELCVDDVDCVAPCVDRGGTTEFCDNSVCQDSTDDFCLPPTKWRMVENALTAGTTIDDAAVTTLSLANGDEHDRLVASDFGFDVPSDAEIVGIEATFIKAISETAVATDDAVVLVDDSGAWGTADRAKPDNWSSDLSTVTYGGPDDPWEQSWSPAEVNAAGFGVAIGVKPGENAGRAYVDVVEMTVYFRRPCD